MKFGNVYCNRRLRQDPCVQAISSKSMPFIRSLIHEEKSDSYLLDWGGKGGKFAGFFKKLTGLQVLRLEDGFVSYLGHPSLGDKCFSIAIDRRGVYYDSRQESDLEYLLNQKAISKDQRLQILEILEILKTHGIAKYNHIPTFREEQQRLNSPHQQVVLLVDQAQSERSIPGALSSINDFDRMLRQCIQDNPDKKILIKPHPDVVLGRKKGSFSQEALNYAYTQGVERLDGLVCTASLLARVDEVHTISSQLGFEALWYGKKVVCYGVPFYAGYGLTEDKREPLRPRKKLDLETLCYHSLISYCRYIDPETLQPCELLDLLPLLIEQKRPRLPENECYAIGFPFWKRCFLPLWFGPGQLHFRPARFESRLGESWSMVWGLKHPDIKKNVIRVEDGFIRSKGLGADLNLPSSLAFDRRGIYFDSTRESDLEVFLNKVELSNQEKARSASLIELILEKGVNKYNLPRAKAEQDPDRWDSSGSRKRILVVGQVDDDASILAGTRSIASSQALLERVRHDRPEDYIIYRPHPDVLAGARTGLDSFDAHALADEVGEEGSILDAIELCDEVHCMTSLAGFEALIRNKTVFCYGMPFYAGWGLTRDDYVCSRRGKTLSIEELVYGALIHYPSYFNYSTKRYTSVERCVQSLSEQVSYADGKVRLRRSQITRNFVKFKLLLASMGLLRFPTHFFRYR